MDKGDPSVVLIKASSGTAGWWCTGTVIAKRLVLTAAHCVEEADGATKMRVMFGSDESASRPGDYIAVKEWHHDPRYMSTSNLAAGHDAAVLILAEDARGAPRAINRTALTSAMTGSPVHVVGFGNDDGQQGTGSGKKREIHTLLAGLEQGVANVGKPGQTTCQGDSGGPSFMNIGGESVIMGITSYGLRGCVAEGSVTRVDLCASWIDPFIAANGGDGATTPPPSPGGACAESEPNDDANAASAVCASGEMRGRISTASDVDWYSWQVPADRTYTINLKTDHEYGMTLYKLVSGSSLHEVTSANDEIARATSDGGTYYLQVRGDNGDFSASDDYRVSMHVTR
jgi:V8-like Glu-specific endopeptidase